MAVSPLLHVYEYSINNDDWDQIIEPNEFLKFEEATNRKITHGTGMCFDAKRNTIYFKLNQGLDLVKIDISTPDDIARTFK